uniref:Rab GTPase-activating protein 1-like n=1 Tax=Phallusia mammillata TaxID=59560 RepID=A0A6F9DQJ4_9ASCI|nr:rab GTPase-activating protein 1-like [Phallusia mammillata]
MDQLSVHSASSDNVSSEFEVVQAMETGLKIADNGNESDLKQNLKEIMTSSQSTLASNDTSLSSEDKSEARPDSLMLQSQENTLSKSPDDEDCILFNGVYYLGCASVNAPRSEPEALRTISILRSQQEPSSELHRSTELPGDTDTANKQIEIVLSIPSRADGTVRLLEPEGTVVMGSYKLYTILFCVRGADESIERDCFAFTESHQQSGIFQCHVFRCDVPEAVRKVLYSFELAFRSIPKSPPTEQPPTGIQLLKRSQISEGESVVAHDSSFLSPGSTEALSQQIVDDSIYGFTVSLEIKEDDGKGGYATVPWDKTSSCFKFRRNLEKKVIVTVTQTSNVELTIERCFGLLLTPGRNVKQSDMHLLDMERAVPEEENNVVGIHTVVGTWDPTHQHFALLNSETQKGTRVFLSVAADLVVQEIQEPVRFLIETKARVFPQTEKFWYFGKKILHENFFLRLNELPSQKVSKKMFEVVSVQSETSRIKWTSSPSHSSHPHPEHALSSTCPKDEEDDDDTDEPLLSGSGEVNRECSERVLSDWGDALSRWHADLSRRPAGLRSLVRAGGVPDALRGEVWQLLAGCHDNDAMLEKYRNLIVKDSPQENIIQRDIHRTFPAHDFFKDTGGLGQDSLYRISKAYSVYDQEVGYCQGLSFLAAALLLHMPEEQAFCVLIKIMYDYKMRDLFKNGFEALHTKFYQLERAMEDLMPSLHDHFKQLAIECHMFSSQWFLTLFTAKFPLNMVFQVVDIFLSEGELVVFRVALGLLLCCRQELLTLDFEGVLKYFRVQLPKKYRSDDQTKLLIQTAVQVKVNSKKLKRYEKDYQVVKEKLALEEDPMIRIERENKHLMDANMRLEMENDDLAQELNTTKLTLHTQLEKTMQHADDLQRDLQTAVEDLRATRESVAELTDENQRLLVETKQVKEMCRREMARQDEELTAKSNIISDYKTICSQLSQRIEDIQNMHKEEVERVRKEQLVNGGQSSESSVGNDAERRSREEKERLQKQIRDLELELAQTKLKLVESECKVQDVEHQMSSVSKELHATKNTWFQKTLSSLTTRKSESSTSGGGTAPLPSPTSQSNPFVSSRAPGDLTFTKRQTVT